MTPKRIGKRFETLESRQMLTAAPEMLTAFGKPDGSTVFFPQEDGVAWLQSPAFWHEGAQIEIFKTDGTEAGTTLGKAIDLPPGSLGGTFSFGIPFQGRFVFEVVDADDVWITDGTAAGTDLLLDLDLPNGSISSMIGNENEFLFFVHNRSHFPNFPDLSNKIDESTEIWVSDGTQAGTRQIFVVGGNDSTVLTDYTSGINGKYFFSISTKDTGFELWSSDGTAEGTHIVTDFLPGPGSSLPPLELAATADQIFLRTRGTDLHYYLYATDGDSVQVLRGMDGLPLDGAWSTVHAATDDRIFGSTRRYDDGVAYDYWTADSSLNINVFETYDEAPANVTVVDGQFQFSSRGEAGSGRFVTDGTTTQRLDRRIVASVRLAESTIELSERNDKFQLFSVEGDERTLLADDIDSHARFFPQQDSVLYFQNKDELWQTDGTIAGTGWAANLRPWQEVNDAHIVGGRVLFKTANTIHVSQIGSVEPPIELLSTGEDVVYSGLVQQYLGQANSRQLYIAGINGPWVTDGTPIGIERLDHSWSISRAWSNTAEVADNVYMLSHKVLWRTNGVAGTTVAIEQLSPSFTGFALHAMGDRLFYFLGFDDRKQLWSTDGSTNGAQLVADDLPVGLNTDRRLRVDLPLEFDGRLYFTDRHCETDGTACWLWQSDGTPEGTGRVDLPLALQDGDGEVYRDLRVVDNKLFFQAANQVWYLDPQNIAHDTGVTFSNRSTLKQVIQGDRYGFAVKERGRTEPWRIATTDGETREVITLHPDRYVVADLWAANGRYFYVATTEGHEGQQMWTVDASGIEHHIADLAEDFSLPSVATDGDYVFFVNDDAMWRSDGVQTLRLADMGNITLGPGFRSNFETDNIGHMQGGQILPFGDTLVVQGESPKYGHQLYAISKEPEPLTGDVDGDFDVDFGDFLKLSANFGKQVDAAMADGDLNADGAVNFDDFLLVAANFGHDLKLALK